MKCNTAAVFAILACVFFVANASLLAVDPHVIDTQYRVPYYTRDFYVRFQAHKDGKEDKLCGGVRLSEKWILTAAECVDKTQYTNVRITTLVNKRTLTHRHAVLTKLDYLVHANFNSTTKANNLALVNVSFDDKFAKFNLTELPRKKDFNKSFINELGVVTGYDLPDKTDPTQVLMVPYATFKIAAPSVCKGLISPSANKDNQICTLLIAGKGLTKDDVGAPLVFLGGRKLYGIALDVRPPSTGKEQPIMFTKIAPYLEWISFNTKIRLEA